jgi:hypothetical protein
VLTADHLGEYEASEVVWHQGEFELVFRRLNAIQFIEYICELVSNDVFEKDEINDMLEKANLSFRLRYERGSLSVEVFDCIKDETISNAQSNIRFLVARMDLLMGNNDFPGVLHTSASIFETLAKEIVPLPSVQNQTLKSFFDRYKKDSHLPEVFKTYILEIYDKRNVAPLAGHGSLQMSVISREEATCISELTKSFVRMEYKLRAEIQLD